MIKPFVSERKSLNTTFFILLFGGTVLLLIWLGTRLRPKPLERVGLESKDRGGFPLPVGLPEPVTRFYQEIYGGEIPVIDSFIISGRGRLRFQGVTLPARLRFTHDAGMSYRHYIEATFWGIPILRVNKHFLKGRARLALPFGVIEGEPQVDQAANLGLWSETLMFPCVYLSAQGTRWESIDETKARLVVPFRGGEEDTFTVFFDQETGLVSRMEALRWKNAGDPEKTRWQAVALEWGEVTGWTMPVLFAARWMDEPSSWLVARIEGVVWNADVSEYILAEGP